MCCSDAKAIDIVAHNQVSLKFIRFVEYRSNKENNIKIGKAKCKFKMLFLLFFNFLCVGSSHSWPPVPFTNCQFSESNCDMQHLYTNSCLPQPFRGKSRQKIICNCFLLIFIDQFLFICQKEPLCK